MGGRIAVEERDGRDENVFLGRRGRIGYSHSQVSMTPTNVLA